MNTLYLILTERDSEKRKGVAEQTEEPKKLKRGKMVKSQKRVTSKSKGGIKLTYELERPPAALPPAFVVRIANSRKLSSQCSKKTAEENLCETILFPSRNPAKV